MGNNTTDCKGSLTRSQEDLILTIRSCVGGAGFLTCVLTITLVFCLKLHKHFIYRLAMYKVTSSMLVDFLDIFTNFILKGHETFHHVLCSVTGFLMIYLFWINVLFTVVIVFHFFSLAVFLKNFKRLEIGYVLFAVLFPPLFLWIPFINDNYGPNGGLCWIKDTTGVNCKPNRKGIIEQYTLWYVPSYFILFFCIAMAIIVIATLLWKGYCQHRRKDEQEPLLNNTDNNKHRKAVIELIPLLAYPAIFLFFHMFAIIYHIIVASNIPVKSIYKMELTHSILSSSWGILSSMALLLLITTTQSSKKCRKHKVTNMSIQETNEIGNSADGISTCTNTTFLSPTESEVERRMQRRKLSSFTQ